MNTRTIEIKPLSNQYIKVTIEGDGDLIINRMNDVTTRQLIDARKDKAKTLAAPNRWEQIITAIHWFDKKYNFNFSEKGLYKALSENKPCITSFGLKKSWGDAVVRNEIDKYKTKFDANVNVIAVGGLVPITFTEYNLDEKLMSPKKGAPVLSYFNRFSGWKAEIIVSFLESVYSLDQIVNIINLAGFGLGIGSGRSSGYGRYHVVGVEALGEENV